MCNVLALTKWGFKLQKISDASDSVFRRNVVLSSGNSGSDMKVMKQHKREHWGVIYECFKGTANTKSMPESLSCVLDMKGCACVFLFGFII